MNNPLQIVDFFRRRRVSWEKIPRNCMMGRAFWSWMEEPGEELPKMNPGIYNQDGTPQVPPVPYEQLTD